MYSLILRSSYFSAHQNRSILALSRHLPRPSMLNLMPYALSSSVNHGLQTSFPNPNLLSMTYRICSQRAGTSQCKWQCNIDNGKVRGIKALTKTLCLDQCYVSRILRLLHLTPPLIEKVIQGSIQEKLYISRVENKFSINGGTTKMQEFHVEA